MLELLVKRISGSEPGFAEKTVRWAIALDSQAGFTGVLELGQPDHKGNRGQLFARCPNLTQPQLISGPSPRSHFLAETASVVALHEVEAGDARTDQKHQFFVHMLREAGKTIPQLATIARLMSDDKILQQIRQAMREEGVKPTDKVTFRLDGEFPLEQDYWHEWWRRFRQGLISGSQRGGSTGEMRCLATGELVTPARTHPKIKGLGGVGGATSGDVLIGCDKDAFCSYGLEQSANAAVSEEAAAAYTESLNKLIRATGTEIAGTIIVHWFKEEIPDEDDPLPWLTKRTRTQQELDAQAKARELLQSLKTGKRPALASNRYYILTISGAAGRVMVRDWLEGEFIELVTNINQWFDDLQIASFAGPGHASSPGLEAVVTSLLPPKRKQEYQDWVKRNQAAKTNEAGAPKRKQEYQDWVKPVTQARRELLQVAIKGIPFPYSILAKLMPLHRAFMLSEDWQSLIKREGDRNTALNYAVLHCRMAIIKAYHLRKYRKEGSTLEKMLTPKLNEDFPEVAYQCGRLLAVLAQIQQAALGDVGAGVVQRFYTAASATPALVLGRLLGNSQHHLNKLDASLARWFEDKIAQITSRITQPLPRTFTLEEQSLFALGYYHQLASFRAGKTEEKSKEKEVQNG
jgi:CRISPR-associated protein Csd1